jgi:FkbM family methyltransferase
MKEAFKNIVKSFSRIFVAMLSSNKIGRFMIEIMINGLMNRVMKINHEGLHMRFIVPNAINRFRVDTFSTKEPETLKWLDSLPEGCTLWDIGANIGLYSVYAVKKKKCRVIAFEPSVFNLELLARNIFLNDIKDYVTIIPIALSDDLGSNFMRLTTTEWGGAESSFGKNFGWDGKKINQEFTFQTMGCTLDQAVDLLHLPQPNYIKMDVDGVEHIILNKGSKVLKKIQGILVEINDNFIRQKKQSRIALEEAGLTLVEKNQLGRLEGSRPSLQNVYNQIWKRI